MIVEAIVNLLALVVKGIISVFPTVPTVDTSYLDNVFQVLSLIDLFLSLKVLVSCLGVIFVVANAQLFWSVVMWVVRKIPGLS